MSRVIFVFCNIVLLAVVVQINCMGELIPGRFQQGDPEQVCWYAGDIPFTQELGSDFKDWHAKNYIGNKDLSKRGQITVGLVMNNNGSNQGHDLCKLNNMRNNGGTKVEGNILRCIGCGVGSMYYS